MDLKLEKKRALITASTAGIGLAIAKRLADEGAIVYINGRSKQRVETAIQEIRKEHPKITVEGIDADLTQLAEIEKLIKKLPSVDILINNLGIYQPKAFEEITDEDWQKIFEVNVMSGIRLSRHYLPQMKANNWGRIVFISSESGLNIPAEMIHYGMTKTAQLAIARGLAETTAGTNVTVNAVLPGPTNSEGVAQFISDMAKTQNKDLKVIEKEFFKTVRPSSLIQRFATTDEVAATVAFVCSPLAAAVNGTSLRVDGGVVRSIA